MERVRERITVVSGVRGEASKRMNGRQRQRRLVWQSMPTATISGTEATTDYRGRESIYHDKIHSAV